MERNARSQLVGAALAIALTCCGCAVPGTGGNKVESKAYPFYSFAAEETDEAIPEDAQEETYTVGRQEAEAEPEE